MIYRFVHVMFSAVFLAHICTAEQPRQWPRVYRVEPNEVVLFQPQVEEWKDFKYLKARSAIKVTLSDVQASYYGALVLEADAVTNHEKRSVLLKNLTISELTFPNVDPTLAARCQAITRNAINPTIRNIEVPLEQIAANVERTQLQQKEIEVNMEPPPIFYSAEPAILVIFMGEPKLEPVTGTKLLYAVNTNWDILMELGTGNYFLLNGTGWLTTKNPKTGPWIPAKTLPEDFNKLPNDENWAEIKKQIPGTPPTTAPKVFFSSEPAEMIVTEGTPSYTPCPGTTLLTVSNTEHDLFLNPADGKHYLLTAGRWFRSSSLDGPWKSAMNDLPAEFAKIDPDSDKSHVLASVPGSAEAEAAVLLASVPQKATVNRSEVNITVTYEGSPSFTVIEKTQVSYAINTPYSVFLVNGRYYCCHQSVWFESSVANGPWVVCAKVPAEIYTIPSTHPMHNVTYVYVYDSTPDTVVVGCTSGYHGSYIVRGLLLFGLGYALGHDDDHYHTYPHYYYHHYGCHYYSYGCAARYDHYHGTYYRAAHAYGPYGGAGRFAAYNPRTGGYARGAARYGPRGGAYAREAYNPYTDRYAARAGARTPYGSWGRSVVIDDDDWARVGHRAEHGKIIVGGDHSDGGKFIGGYNRWTDDGGFIGKDDEGDIYVGGDGEIYKRDDDGGWHQRDDGDWDEIDAPVHGVRPLDTQDLKRPVKDQPVRSQPVTTQPVRSQPVKTQPVKAQPVRSQPITTQPTERQKPVTTQPVRSQPITTQPTERQKPVTTQPVRSQPVESRPVTTQPVRSQPVTTQPVTTQPTKRQPSASTYEQLQKASQNRSSANRTYQSRPTRSSFSSGGRTRRR